MARRSNKGSRGQPEMSRNAILDAAAHAFSSHGLAGARTDAIAHEAGVNKALLYYYFRDKEGLYGAVLERVFAGLLAEISVVLESDLGPGEKIIKYALTHFNYVAAHPEYRRLVQHEMMRAGGGAQQTQIPVLIQQFFRPLATKLVATLEQGMKCGEFRRVQPTHFMQSMIAVIVFYFSSVPIVRAMAAVDPLSEAGIAQRREAMLDFIAAALFKERERGSRIVGKVILEHKQSARKPAATAQIRQREAK